MAEGVLPAEEWDELFDRGLLSYPQPTRLNNEGSKRHGIYATPDQRRLRRDLLKHLARRTCSSALNVNVDVNTSACWNDNGVGRAGNQRSG